MNGSGNEVIHGPDSANSWIYSLLLTAALFGFPIVSAVPVVLQSDSRSFSIAYRALVVLLSLWCVWQSLRSNRPFIGRVIRWPLAGFVIMLGLRLFWDSDVKPLPLDIPWGDFWQQIIGITLIPALPFLVVPEQSWLIRCHRISLWAALLCAISIIIGVIFSVKTLLAGGSNGRLMTDVLNSISLGAAGTSIYVIASTYRVKRGFIERIVKALCLMLGPLLCLMSGSKTPILALCLLILIQYLFPAKAVSSRTRLMQALLILAVLIGLFLFSDNTDFDLFSRFKSVGTDQSTMLRIAAWNGAMTQFNHAPFFGDAAFESTLRTYPHNIFADALMTTGLVGFSMFLFVLIVSMISVFKLLRTPHVRWLSLVFIQTLLGAQTSGSLYFDGVFWVMVLAMIAAGSRPANGLAHESSALAAA